jgi:DNA-binding MarR family transcriptional regulator
MSDNAADHELTILQKISQSNGGVPQRNLARIIGLSLGMTNAILKRLAQKGWLQIRKVNNRNIQYVVSPRGMEEIARRSYRYFRRTIKNVVYYKEAIDTVVAEARQRGYRRVVLVGKSDLGFIVEHLSAKRGLGYAQRQVAGKAEPEPRDFLLFSENTGWNGQGVPGSASLRGLLVRRSVEGKHL